MADGRIRRLEGATDASSCDAIIASLPGWFGDEDGLRQCAAAVRSQPGFVVERDGQVLAFLTVVRPRPQTAEISWMAAHADHRGAGHGRALIDALVTDLHATDVRFLAVKTLSDRHPDLSYAETRAFYGAMGFMPLMDLDVWGPESPAMLLVRSLA